MMTPEARARVNIDEALEAAGWNVQDRRAANLSAARGVAVREFPLKRGFGEADYLLFADGQAVGVVEAKPEGATLTGVEPQSEKYGAGLPDQLDAPVQPLPFLYQSTGVETRFTNGLDPDPGSRGVFAFHRPETLATWIDPDRGAAEADDLRWVAENPARYGVPRTIKQRLQSMPPLTDVGLWPAQRTAILNLEQSMAAGIAPSSISLLDAMKQLVDQMADYLRDVIEEGCPPHLINRPVSLREQWSLKAWLALQGARDLLGVGERASWLQSAPSPAR